MVRVCWLHALNPSSANEPLPAFESASLTFLMTYCDPVPHVSIARHIEESHGIVRGQRAQGRLLVIQREEATLLHLGGSESGGPLVTVDLSEVTVTHDTYAPRLLDKISFSFMGKAQTNGLHGAEAEAEFRVFFDTEAAFWAFVSLSTSENYTHLCGFFRHTGIRYRDSPAAQASTTEAIPGPMPEWMRVQTLLWVVMLGFLPPYLVLILFFAYFSAV